MFERLTMLVIEPDPAAADELRALLGVRYSVHTVGSAASARAWLGSAPRHPAAIVFELALPDADGLILCAELRGTTEAALLVHTRLSGQRELVLSLRLGADDFVAKPADPDELEARLGALVRRAARSRRAAAYSFARDSPGSADAAIQLVGDLSIDRERAMAVVGGRPLHLTQSEFRLLSAFALHLGAPLARDQLTLLTTGHGHIAGNRSLDIHVRRLRWKLRAAAEAVPTARAGTPVRVPVIVSVRGLGYGMVEPTSVRDELEEHAPGRSHTEAAEGTGSATHPAA